MSREIIIYTEHCLKVAYILNVFKNIHIFIIYLLSEI